jgi:hypothetical protein
MMQLPQARRSPALTNGRGGEYEQEWVEGMKLADVFTIIVSKAWRNREAKQKANISPKYVDRLPRVSSLLLTGTQGSYLQSLAPSTTSTTR